MPPITPTSAMSTEIEMSSVDGGSTKSVYCAKSTPPSAANAAEILKASNFHRRSLMPSAEAASWLARSARK